MPKKRRTGRRAELMNLEMALSLNGQAIKEGPKRKTWSMHDLKTIQPLSPTQTDMFHAWYNGLNICAHGSAGSGKSFIALYLALQSVFQGHQQNIIIIRSAVAARDMGFLPGTKEEKMEGFEQPYHNILWELIGRQSTYSDMKTAGLIEFHSTSFLRGLTWDNSVIIFDEIQNASWEEINTVLTRVGQNSRVILCGDTAQDDLHFKKTDMSGMPRMLKVIDRLNTFERLLFTHADIVRSDFVKQWIIACEEVRA